MASSTYAIRRSAGYRLQSRLLGVHLLDDLQRQHGPRRHASAAHQRLANQAGSAFFNTPLNIQSFTTDFTMQLSNPVGDGMTFTIQDVAPTALGLSGGGLGYGPAVPGATDPASILKSVAIKFDLLL